MATAQCKQSATRNVWNDVRSCSSVGKSRSTSHRVNYVSGSEPTSIHLPVANLVRGRYATFLPRASCPTPSLRAPSLRPHLMCLFSPANVAGPLMVIPTFLPHRFIPHLLAGYATSRSRNPALSPPPPPPYPVPAHRTKTLEFQIGNSILCVDGTSLSTSVYLNDIAAWSSITHEDQRKIEQG